MFAIVDRYIDDLFAPEDEALRGALASARAAGLPDIQITAGQGKFLYLLAKIAGARRMLEIGTLGGYSTIWLARALPEGGRLTSLEIDLACARVAEEAIGRAGLADRVEIRLGKALDTLPPLLAGASDPFDLVFLDADKVSYLRYLDLVVPTMRSGGLIVADNVVRAGTVLAPRPDDASAGAARSFNAALAADPRLESIVLQQVGVKGHDGIAIARVR